MGEVGAEGLMDWGKVQGDAEERILVLVRLRPLSEKETLQNEVADWECINTMTILYRNSLQERSGLPKAYSFDRVFRGDNTTREVYNEGVKDIALSVVGGINSTIFAYGQTSSGKTYTMNGITEYTVADIYEYMKKHEEREFVLKFSAIEIYNEVVRDLLNADNTALRLLDDPEKGTIIEKLTEETLRDWNHLKKLMSICETQRQIAETQLNEASSRSHQILRLTIESSAREFMGNSNSTTLAASVNFVDLAGSERASQALSIGQRLKEGCHINRSLLTLGTVIRKLSKGRHGHVNYRDSKLTRILQPALGGNARTAIICTLSPARSHVEQSRNTLLFATCAKEVSTNAQVNVVMTDKALVKHLQKEVARLESELRISGPTCDHAALLRKKDVRIEKLEEENRELKKQLDIARSRNNDLFNAIEDYKSALEATGVQSVDRAFLSNGVPGPLPSENEHDNYSSESASYRGQRMVDSLIGYGEDSEEISPEAHCADMDEKNGGKSYESFSPATSCSEVCTPNHVVKSFASSRRAGGNGNDSACGEIEHRVQGLHSMDSLVTDANSPSVQSDTAAMCSNIGRSRSCRAYFMITGSPNSEMPDQNEATPPTILEQGFTERTIGAFTRKQWKLPPVIYGADGSRITRNDSLSSGYRSFVDATVDHESSATHWDEEIPTLGSFVAGLKQLARTEYENQSEPQVQVKETMDDEESSKDLDLNTWPARFDKLRSQIIELWQSCNVSLVHRTYFFLLIKKELTYSIYVEVEHRRLSFLKETFSRGNSAQQDGRVLTQASSKKALQREREVLSRLMYKRYTEQERIQLYEEWGIAVNSKRRRLQLARRLWTDAGSLYHVAKSAAIVAKLIGFLENGRTVEEMLGLRFSPAATISRRSFRWKDGVSSLL